MPRIYTKTGDDGSTGLLYGGRISKADLATDAYGTTDEAVAALGLARSLCEDPDLREDLLVLQRELFVVGADLAANPAKRKKLDEGVSLVTDDMVRRLEQRIDDLVAQRPLPQVFIVPGANPASAALDLARSVVRRAERRVVELERAEAHGQPGGPPLPEPAVGPALRAGAVAGRRGRARQSRGPGLRTESVDVELSSPRGDRYGGERAVVVVAEQQRDQADRSLVHIGPGTPPGTSRSRRRGSASRRPRPRPAASPARRST